MRGALIPLFALLIATSAWATTLAEAGITPTVVAPAEEQNWSIPYVAAEDCNNIFIFHLISGIATIYDNGKVVETARTPGWYRAVLSQDGGTLTINLKRKPGESVAKIDENSYIVCDRVPILEVNVDYPKVFHAGGYDTITFNIRNVGSAGTEATIVLNLPSQVAPLSPRRTVHIPALSERNATITTTTADVFPEQLFQPQIIEYADRHGKYVVKTKFGITSSEEFVPLACIIHNKTYEIINIGTKPININKSIINPGNSITIKNPSDSTLHHCVIRIKIQNMHKNSVSDPRSMFTTIWGIAAILGIILGEKEIKRRKA